MNSWKNQEFIFLYQVILRSRVHVYFTAFRIPSPANFLYLLEESHNLIDNLIENTEGILSTIDQITTLLHVLI